MKLDVLINNAQHIVLSSDSPEKSLTV